MPSDSCNKIDAATRRFWWKPKDRGSRYIAWASWDKLCRPKKFGGLGFKKTKEMNLALIAKFAWFVASNRQSLCMDVLRSKYKVNSGWLTANSVAIASPTWKAIEEAKKLVAKGECFIIGNGKSVQVWSDPLVPEAVNFMPQPRLEEYIKLTINVSELIYPTTKSWISDWVKELFAPTDARAILNMSIPMSQKEDKLVWLSDSKGRFSVKSIHNVAFAHPDCVGQPQACWSKLWKAKFPERLKMLIWRISINAMPTKANLQVRLNHVDASCLLCNAEQEDSEHIFFRCPFARALWSAACWGLQVDNVTLTSTKDIVSFIMEPPASLIPTHEAWSVSLNMALVIDEIWMSRNLKQFSNIDLDALKARQNIQTRFNEIVKVSSSTT